MRPPANGTKWIESLLESMAKYEDLSTYFDSTSMCYKSIFGTKKADTKDPKFVLNAALLKCVVVTDLLAFPYSFYRGLSKFDRIFIFVLKKIY